MYKLVELEKDNYEKFVKPHKSKSHFLQSYAWGEFLGMLNRRNPYYLGLLVPYLLFIISGSIFKNIPFLLLTNLTTSRVISLKTSLSL